MSADPFTPEAVLALLRDKVLKGNSALPPSTDPEIADLAWILRFCRQKVQGGDQAWREDKERFARIAAAIEVLDEILPSARQDYKAIAEAMAGHRAMAAAEVELKADIAAVDALIDATRVARERGLPVAPVQNCVRAQCEHAASTNTFPFVLPLMMLMRRPWERWQDFAELLQDRFQSALPGRPKEAAYRFIVEVTPAITGERPSLQAVKTAFKKNRLVNRGERTG